MLARIGVSLIAGLSKLPFSVLYGLSDILHFFIFTIVGYRKRVILNNIKNAFPEKPKEEHHRIAKVFGKYLVDVVVESIKTFSITKEELQERMRVTFSPEYEQCVKEGRNAIVVLGHQGNWEYAQLAFSAEPNRQEFLGVYKAIKNQAVSDVMLKSRAKFGTILIETKEFKDGLGKYVKQNIPVALGLMADQAPQADRGYWMRFLNQDTPVFLGPERYAKRLNAPVFFGEVKPVKRGYYTLHIEPLVLNPLDAEEGEITEKHVLRLEQEIREYPEYWLWSHKRWKRTRPEDLKPNQKSTRYPGQ